MNTAEALDLIRKKLDDCAEGEELVQLVEELESYGRQAVKLPLYSGL
jgi:hypothetical protein